VGAFVARNKKGPLSRKCLNLFIFLVGRDGLETSANGLYLDGDLSQQPGRFHFVPVK